VEPDPFSIEDHQAGRRHTLVLRGELDMASAPALEGMLQELCEGGAQELVVDLSELTFMDSTGLNAILKSRTLCAEHVCDLGLIPGRRPVQRVFELTHLLDRLPFRNAGEAQRAGPPAPGRRG
jgi:anti-sigma B factor antagonist